MCCCVKKNMFKLMLIEVFLVYFCIILDTSEFLVSDPWGGGH